MSAFLPLATELRTLLEVRFVQILLQKSFWGGERKFLKPLMRFTRGDVRDHIVSSKIDHWPSGVEKRRSSREVERSVFARFLGLFDFRLLQQYRSKAEVAARPHHVGSSPNRRHSSTPKVADGSPSVIVFRAARPSAAIDPV
jgi:hypothetical protein